MKRCHVPAFGHWNWSFYDEDIPISQYFESRLFGGDHGGDLFKVLSPCKDQVGYVSTCIDCLRFSFSFSFLSWIIFLGCLKEKQEGKRMKSLKGKKIGRKNDAADEDLYKIPSEVIYQMPKKAIIIAFLSCFLSLEHILFPFFFF